MREVALKNPVVVGEVIGWNIALILSSQAHLNLPFSPVPITLQTLVLLLIIFSLKKNAYIPVAAYIVEGGLGLPVFAGWSGGIWKILGPTGGYIAGFLVASMVFGGVWDKIRKGFWAALLTGFATHIVVYTLGVIQLSLFVGLNRAVYLGVVPFIVGDTLKTLVAAAIYPKWKNFTHL